MSATIMKLDDGAVRSNRKRGHNASSLDAGIPKEFASQIADQAAQRFLQVLNGENPSVTSE